MINLNDIFETAISEEDSEVYAAKSSRGEEASENAAIEIMCNSLGIINGDWAANDAVQEWLRENSKAYIAHACEIAGVNIRAGDGLCPIWMQAAGVLRLAARI